MRYTITCIVFYIILQVCYDSSHHERIIPSKCCTNFGMSHSLESALYLKGEISVCRTYEAFLSQTISLISRFEEIGEYLPSKTIILPVSFSKTTIQSIVIQR